MLNTREPEMYEPKDQQQLLHHSHPHAHQRLVKLCRVCGDQAYGE